MNDNPGGSCEPCKKKKCKCDRKVPECSNCAGTNLKCQYAEGNKRGIPTGYLGTLEQRLTETENVLSHALKVLQQLGGITLMNSGMTPGESENIVVNTGPETNINKTARMAQWKTYPLQSAQNLSEWQRFFTGEDCSKTNEPCGSRPLTSPTPATRAQGASEENANMATSWQHEELEETTELPREYGLQPGAIPAPMHPGPKSHMQSSPSSSSQYTVNSNSSGTPDEQTRLRTTPYIHSDVDRPRPSGLDQTANAATNLSVSQKLAATNRNKYY